MTDLLDAALAYAARGWPVFPCTPGAKAPAGHLAPHGVLDATTDPARIRQWWTVQPDANVGIATGAPGPDVIDVDVKPEGSGYTAFAEIASAGLADGPLTYVRTPSGGLHLYYLGTGQRNGSIRRRQLDFRGAGGYVLAPPSAVEGRPYTEAPPDDDCPPGRADWRAIRTLLDPPPEPPAFQQPPRDTGGQADTGRPGDAWASVTTWDQILAPHGWRKVRELGGGRALWCRPGKTGNFTSATTRDDGGLYVFSTSTPFDPEVPYSKFGALAVLDYGGDHAAAAAQLRRDGYGAQAQPLTLTQPPQPAVEDDSTGEPVEGAEVPGQDARYAELAARHDPIDWQQLWDDTPVEEEWIIEPLLAAGRSIAVYSPPKVGKSLLALEIAAAVAAGRPVLGQPAAAPRRVLYVDLENSRRDIKDRLTDLGYGPHDLAELVYLSFPSLPALDSAQGGEHMVALAVTHKVVMVVIDTVSRVISGGENDADTFAALYRHALAPLKGRNIAVFRLDHAGKDATRGQRGSSAKNADVDAVWTLSKAGPNLTLQCEMSRTAHEVQALVMRRQTGPLRHELTTQAAAEVDRVQGLMAKLDELGVPRDWGRDRCIGALNKAGVPVGAKWAVEKAVATRKQQLNLPDDLEGSPAPRAGAGNPANLPGPSRAGIDETADETCPNPSRAGAGRSFQGVPVQPARRGSPTIGGDPGAGADAGAPLCTDCGERHHRYGDQGRPCFARKSTP